MTAECSPVPVEIDEYLADIDRRLRGPARLRRAIRDELRDGLLEAARDHCEAGLTADRSVALALREFGEPGVVAAAFAPELAARDARRVAVGLVRSGPLVGVLWGLAALASGYAVGHEPPWRWPLPGIHLAFPVIAAAITTSLLAGALAIAATGRLGARARVLSRTVPRARTAAATIAASAIAADLALLTLLFSAAADASSSIAWVPAAIAAAASLTRLLLAARATRRLLAPPAR